MSRDIGQYKVFNCIGKGSFGIVYKGIDKITGEEVALKFIEKKKKGARELRGLRQQNELLRKISHPNVILLKDVIQTQNEIIIVTDYAGRDLSGVMEEVKKFPLQKCKDLSIQILNAMLYLNEARITHRDLKPQNILIRNNHIKLCDFGFAKKLSASTKFMNSMKGTPLYLAPEIVSGSFYTEKVDIWSFGCIIYELFTGRTPYYANTMEKLKPLILYQAVHYPKQMPVEMRELISSMLQKNASARPNWKQLKEHSFFKQPQILQQRLQNNIKEMKQMKQVVSIEYLDNNLVLNKPLYPENATTGLAKQQKRAQNGNKQNSNKQHFLPFQHQQQEQQFQQSKVIQKIASQQQLKSYLQQFQTISRQLTTGQKDGNHLLNDVIFLHKIKTIFHQRSQQNVIITNELLEAVFSILIQLIKIKKTYNNNNNATNQKQPIQQNNNQNNFLISEQDDITKNENLIIGILCLAKVEENYDMLEKELKMICLLIKRNFNGVAINAEIDQEITEFITEILLENSHKMPIQCVRNGLIIIGTLVNQALMTINNSFMYFQRIAEDNLLKKIANIYQKEQKYAIVLQCLKQFIHPIREVPSMNGNHSHFVLQARMVKVFDQLKQQVCEGLLKTNFMSQKSPIEVYGQKSPHIVDYCEVLLQCLTHSKEMRNQFLKYTYWPQLLKIKKTRAFLFAYNQIMTNKQSQEIIPNQIMSNYTKQSQQNKLINIFIVQIGCGKLKKKLTKVMQKQMLSNVLLYGRSILQKISEFIFIQEETKAKCVKQIYGTLQTTSVRFDQPMIEIFYQIVEGMKVTQLVDQNKQLIQSIFKRVCSVSAPFKPNAKSLYNLITLYTQSEIMKKLKGEKSIQQFFYECISDFLKREDYQYLEIDFQQKFIPQFVVKMIKCLNYLIDVQQPGSKGQGSLSQLAIGLSKQIQTSSFYRFMFVDELVEEQFYQHLRYIQRVITKTAQIMPELINFLGVKVVPMCRHFIQTKNQQLIIQMCIFLSQLARDHSQFNNEIMNIRIISRFNQWLVQQSYSQGVKQKTLYLIGNLAKRSEYFFMQFQTHKVLDGVAKCLQKHYENMRIFKNTIYSVGNISFYSQKFYSNIQPMIVHFARAFQMKDSHLQNNLISTVSNLMRFSNIYLKGLIKSGVIGHVLKIACYGSEMDQCTGNLLLSLIKKMLPYEQFYFQFGYKELKMIYQRRQLFGGDGNETIKKIKDVLVRNNQVL